MQEANVKEANMKPPPLAPRTSIPRVERQSFPLDGDAERLDRELADLDMLPPGLDHKAVAPLPLAEMFFCFFFPGWF